MSCASYEELAIAANDVVGVLLGEEPGDREATLVELAVCLERTPIPEDERAEYLARCVHRATPDIGQWLHATAGLCRLVVLGEEDEEELIERLFALHWAWRELPRGAHAAYFAHEDEYMIWRSRNECYAREDLWFADMRDPRHPRLARLWHRVCFLGRRFGLAAARYRARLLRRPPFV